MTRFLLFSFFLFVSIGNLLVGCSRSGSIGPPIPTENFLLLDSRLKQGVSTKMDVQKLLGTPSGFGAALFPKTSDIHHLLGLDELNKIPGIRYSNNNGHEVWLYQNMEFEQQPSSQVALNQKILLVFFKDNIYDGYLWYLGSGVINVN